MGIFRVGIFPGGIFLEPCFSHTYTCFVVIDIQSFDLNSKSGDFYQRSIKCKTVQYCKCKTHFFNKHLSFKGDQRL